MTLAHIGCLSSMPLASPSYPRGPYRFIDREYLTIIYESEPEAIRDALPEPGEHVNFTAQMYLDDEPPIAGGREVWGFPKKHGRPKLEVMHDTLTGTLDYAGVRVAVGTMGYKHQHLLYDVEGRKACSPVSIVDKLGKTQVNPKLIPGIDGEAALAKLAAYDLADIQVKGAWSGPARLHLVPHVNAPVADLPVKRTLGGLHFIADLTLPYGRVLFDYLAP